MLSVRLLGVPQLVLDRRPLDTLRRKNRALVYYLAARAKPTTRDHVLALFWPDHERQAAQKILRTMVYDLRKQLGPALSVADEQLALAPDTWVDVQAFEAGLAAPAASITALTATLELYRGDYLEGFTLADSPAFDDWAMAERARYRAHFIRGLAALADLHAANGDHSRGLDALTRALTLDPLQENLQCAAMRLQYLAGDRAGAIRRFETLRRSLDDELGVPPLPETRALYDAIIKDEVGRMQDEVTSPAQRSSPPPNPSSFIVHPSSLPFVGRDAELRQLRELTAGHQLVLIEGEPGIGKTRLAEEFLAGYALPPAQAAQPQRLMLRGGAHEFEQGLPYQPIIDALRGLLSSAEWPGLRVRLDLAPIWLAEVARLVPELQAELPDLPVAAPVADEARLSAAVSQFLHSLARERQVAVFLDDLHWADAATLNVLGYLARRAASPAILLLGTARPAEARSRLAPLLRSLTHENRLARLPLASLSADDMAALAEQLSPAQPDPLLGWLARNAEGNPYFLTELVRYAYSNGLLLKDGRLDHAALASPYALPASIENLILSRIIRLSADARRVLDMAATLGREFDFELVSHATSLAEGAALDALDELRAAGLIQARGGAGFAFDHSLTMQVAIQEMGEPRLRASHRRLAETLEELHRNQLDPIAGLIARHFADGNAPLRAAPYAFRAGKHAAQLAAWAEAISFYTYALGTKIDDAQRSAVFLALGQARFHKGEFRQATDAYRTAAELAQASGDIPGLELAHLMLNQSLLPQARFAEAIALGQELRRAGPAELALCAEFTWGTGLAVESAHPAEAEAHLRQAEALFGRQAGYTSRITLAQIKYQLAGVMGQQGNSAQAVALYWEALNLVRHDDAALDLLRHIMLYNNLAYQLHLLGDASASTYIEKGIQLAQERGSLSHLPYLYSTSGEIALAAKDLDTAEKYFRDGLRLAEQIPLRERIAGMTANLGLVAKARGKMDLARERLQKALTVVEPLGNHHLEVRIRIWLAPLLETPDARSCLHSARILAERDGLYGLLEEIKQLESGLGI